MRFMSAKESRIGMTSSMIQILTLKIMSLNGHGFVAMPVEVVIGDAETVVDFVFHVNHFGLTDCAAVLVVLCVPSTELAGASSIDEKSEIVFSLYL